MSQIPLNAEGGEAGVVGVRLPDPLRQRLFATAKRRGTTPSAVLREMLADYFERLVSDELDALAAEIGGDGHP